MQAILIKGGVGFIESNFIPYFLKEKIEYNAVNSDLLKFAGDLKNVVAPLLKSGFEKILMDI
jgi:dTDP-glucose 4,6-dehydratase|tara:strand:- start:2010 stop:2195 length:186 start_codon:yes stop_codon:yes gene_type:complete